LSVQTSTVFRPGWLGRAFRQGKKSVYGRFDGALPKARRFGMNEDLKRLLGVLNKAGYEVFKLEDEYYTDGGSCHSSGIFSLTVFDTSKGQSEH
jgi:hypothetical protein